MPKGNDFTEINPAETVTLTWDFGNMLAAGVSLSAPSTSCAVVSGTDAGAAGRLVGNPLVITSPTTGRANQAIVQQVSAMVAGVVYLLAALVNTSDNQVLQIYAHAPCNAPA